MFDDLVSVSVSQLYVVYIYRHMPHTITIWKKQLKYFQKLFHLSCYSLFDQMKQLKLYIH